jgi:hypothetical protein
VIDIGTFSIFSSLRRAVTTTSPISGMASDGDAALSASFDASEADTSALNTGRMTANVKKVPMAAAVTFLIIAEINQ